MKLTAVVALNLALLRVTPTDIILAPAIAYLIVMLDLALVEAFVFGRPLGTFYFTFLGVGFLSFGVATALAFIQPRFEPAIMCVLALAPAFGAAALASWWARRRGDRKSEFSRAVASFLQGAVIGFALYMPVPIVADAFLGLRTPESRWCVVGGMVACPLLVGLAVPRFSRARSPTRQGAGR
jgi:hypothetical protein